MDMEEDASLKKQQKAKETQAENDKLLKEIEGIDAPKEDTSHLKVSIQDIINLSPEK